MPVYKYKDYVKIMRPLPDYVARDIYDIPFIEIDDIDISNLNNGKWLVNVKNCSKNDKHQSEKIVHNFCYDEVLMRDYNNPFRFLEKVGPYFAASSSDFSMDSKMGFKEILDATYNNRWMGAFLQTHGKKVIPTVGWVGAKYYDITFAGLRDGGVFIISTIGANNDISYAEFIDGYHELRRRFPNTQLICVGDFIEGMDSDICYIPYEDSFGSWDKKQDWWQPKLFNWDMSYAMGGVADVI